MSTRRSFLAIGSVGVFALCLGLQALASDQTSKDFVTSIYRNYQGKDAKGIPLNSPTMRRVLTPSLMKLIDEDSKRAARRSEVGDLDGDPFVDAQDWDIKSFAIDVQDTGPDKAIAKVGFKNFDTNATVRLALVKLNGAWRIDDFNLRAGSVRKLLTKK